LAPCRGRAIYGLNILILDDDTELLDALSRILEHHGHSVDCADNAELAVDMVAQGNYNLLLVDYKMPGNDGVWFMENVDLPRESKVLLITAYVNRDIINKMFKLGASGYLIKPFDEEELLRHVSYYCKDEDDA